MPDYPKRSSHFAHKAFRLMLKTCLAQEIGQDAVLLIGAILHTEDAKRYRGPVTFYNGQLQPILGFRKWDRLKKARDRAVEAGWLHYEHRGNHKPGIYWTLIPEEAGKIDDSPIDEPYVGNGYADGGNPESLYPGEGYNMGYKEGYNMGYKEGYNMGYKEGDPPYPVPNPKPVPNPSPPSKPPKEAEEGDKPDVISGEEAELRDSWNALDGVRPIRGRFSKKRLAALKERLADPDWRDTWREAIDRVAESRFCCGDNDRGWKATIDWFLRPDTVQKLVEGHYDFGKERHRNGHQPKTFQRQAFENTMRNLAAFAAEDDEPGDEARGNDIFGLLGSDETG